uniref:Uncharacterized protein n=1 Tax=Microplitis mediator bracovirus TaxID=1836595 RepID=A0A2I6SGV6_9VIRU|nr:hypothetical protein MmBV_CLP4 [Microplitis mediator bracovirus]
MSDSNNAACKNFIKFRLLLVTIRGSIYIYIYMYIYILPEVINHDVGFIVLYQTICYQL